MPQEIYTTPGVWHKFTVPPGVETLYVDVRGAGNGATRGGWVAGNLSVQPGAVFYIACGHEGREPSGRQGGGVGWGGGGQGGDGRNGGSGGEAGGGGSGITLGNPPGWMRVVAGGAGGRSGDSGPGGAGGADNGEMGSRGFDGGGGVVRPDGGSQQRPGTGGKNQSARPAFDGGDGSPGPLERGGTGGTAPAGTGQSHGGGGGGGGMQSGGGGNASGANSPATGGGGGSNYAGGLSAVSANARGEGNLGNGSVLIMWEGNYEVDENGKPVLIQPPPPPSDVKVEGVDLGTETSTRAMTQVTFTGTISNPNPGIQSQMVVRLVPADNDDSTEEWNFGGSFMTYFSNWVSDVSAGDTPPQAVSVTITGLQPNQKYYVRAYTFDSGGRWSQGMGDDPAEGGFSGGSFWTNRPPSPPRLQTPSDNVQFEVIDNIFFSWSHVDPDESDPQSAAEIRVRRLTRPNEGVITDWALLASLEGKGTSYSALASIFTGNQFYIWSVRTRDAAGVWSNWTQPNSFYVEAATTPPVILSPRRGEAVVAAQTTLLKWQYIDPIDNSTQVRADVRFRVVGTEDWVTYYGDPEPGQPGSFPEWAIPPYTFIEGYHYEWQARTVNSALLVSDWSVVEDFWATAQPGEGLAPRYLLPEYESIQPPLGCGVSRVFVYDRGGEIMRGEITPLTTVRYGRQRDDISSCTVFVNGFGPDCGALLSELRSWMHELVVFRDGKRVWEGPITRITEEPGQVEIEAKDVLAYAYRRIMRQGYNDTYREINGVKEGGLSVVRRAGLTIMNGLAYDDPNVLRWLTEIRHSDDAIQHRSVPDFSKMVWEEVDDLAANAGLDYTTVGRRIVLWDTHRALGRLPEMRDEDFSAPVHVTEYGMQLANFFAVTNNNGIYGTASRGMSGVLGEKPPYYGWVEQLVSAYGETEGDATVDLTEEARASLEETLAQQADRGISPRWPTPLVVRVPDNSTLNPDINLGFDQLVPGVWIPVRTTKTLRNISQWQKLDSVVVEQTGDGGERISVTMSPAPNEGIDPDADAAALEAT